jgi:hypothetical protein
VGKAIIVLGVLAVCCLTEAFYVPRFGPAALLAAHDDYLNCVSTLPFIERSHRRSLNDFRMTWPDCAGAYLDRQETIRWRYFFFQTLAARF